MKNAYFYSAFLAFLLSGGVAAQNLPVDVGAAQTECAQLTPEQLVKYFSVKELLHFNGPAADLTPLVAPVAPQLLDDGLSAQGTVDTTLCVRVVGRLNGEQFMQRDYDFDEFGYRQSMQYTTNDSDVAEQYRYRYEIGAFNYWTSRIIERSKGDDWSMVGKVVRVINDKRQLLSIASYALSAEGKLVKVEEKRYDYSHRYIVNKGKPNEHMALGALVYSAQYDKATGQLLFENEWEWMPAEKTYVQVKNLRIEEGKTIYKMLGEIKRDELIQRVYEPGNGGELRLTEEKHIFFDFGTYTVNYGPDGEKSYSGECIEVDYENTSDGYIRYTHSQSEGDHMQPLYRAYIKGLSAEHMIQPGKDFYVKAERFSTITNSFLHYGYVQAKCISGNLYRADAVVNFGGFEKKLNLDVLVSMDEYKVTVVHYIKSEKLYALSDIGVNLRNPARMAGYVEYYNLDHELVNRVKVDERPGAYDYYHFAPNRYLAWKNQSWEAVPQVIRNEINDRGFPVVVFYSCNEKGYPVNAKTYDMFSSEKRLISDTDFEYTENGSVTKTYLYDANEKRSGAVHVAQYEMFDSKDVCFTQFDLKVKGEQQVDTLAGSRKVITPGNISTNYLFDVDKKQFVEQDKSFNMCYTYDEERDLLTELCYQLTGDDNQIVYDWKRTYNPGPNDGRYYMESYRWDIENGEWVGVEYCKQSPVGFKLPIKEVANPEGYDDTGRGLVCLAEIDLNLDPEDIDEESYVWNKELKKWDLEYIQKAELLSKEGNTYQLKVTSKDYCGELENVFAKLTLLDDGKPVEFHMNGMFEGMPVDETTKYTYDENGNCIKYEEFYVDYDGKDIHLEYSFDFKAFELQPTAIVNVMGKAELKVSGRHVVVPAGALVEVYDMGGRKVMSGKGQLTLPAAGSYVVKSGGYSVKIVCK